MHHQTCTKCQKEKEIKYFAWRTDTKKYRAQCNYCHKGYHSRREEMGQRVADGMKPCGKCGEVKPLSEFHKDKYMRYGLTSWCKPCKFKYMADNQDAIRITRIANVYSVTKEKATELYNAKTCEICKADITKKKNIDHDHTSGEVRAALCQSCNFGLGQFRDNPAHLREAANYLDRYQF